MRREREELSSSRFEDALSLIALVLAVPLMICLGFFVLMLIASAVGVHMLDGFFRSLGH